MSMRLGVAFDRGVRRLQKAWENGRYPQSPLGTPRTPRSPAGARTPQKAPPPRRQLSYGRRAAPRTRDLLLLFVSLAVLLHALLARRARIYRPLIHWRRDGFFSMPLAVVMACERLDALNASLATLHDVPVVAAVPLALSFASPPANLRLLPMPAWRAPLALNVAAARARARWLLLLPCGCDAPIVPSVLDEGAVYVARRAEPFDVCAHTAVLTKAEYFDARGADERGAAPVDRTLRARLLAAGFRLRAELDVLSSVAFNAEGAAALAADDLLQDGVPSWHEGDAPVDHGGNFKDVHTKRAAATYRVSGRVHTLVHGAPRLEELVAYYGGGKSDALRALAQSTGARNVLRSRYHIPLALTAGMAPATTMRMLKALAAEENKRYSELCERHAERELTSEVRVLAGAASLRSRILAVEPMHGLGNRLRAVASARAFARSTGRLLLVVWVRDAHCLAAWEALFAADEAADVYVSAVTPGWPLDARGDGAWAHWHVVDYMSGDKELPLADDARHIAVRSAYALRGDPPKLATWAATNDELRQLPPSARVAELVRAAEAAAGTSGVRTAVGVHVRSRPLDGEVKGADYGVNGTALLRYWRAKSAPRAFEKAMRGLPAETRFVVAADSEEGRELLRQAFPTATVLRGCDDRGELCVLQAYAELLVLARTRQLLASPWSSFSEVAARLGGIRMRLAGIDFDADDPKDVHAQWGDATADVVGEVLRRRRLKDAKRRHRH